MASLNARTIINHTESVTTCAALAFNFYFLYVVVRHTPQVLRPYRPILMQTCLVDILYSIINGVTKAHVDAKGGYFIVLMQGVFVDSPTPYNLILMSSWVFSLFYCMTTVPVPFVYRYILIVANRKITSVQYMYLLLPSFISALIYAVYGGWIYYPNVQMVRETAKLLQKDEMYAQQRLNFITASIQDRRLLVLFGYCYVLVTASYCVTIFAGYQVWVHLKTVCDGATVRVIKVHQQLTWTLCLQATLPVVFIMLPCAAVVTATFLGDAPAGALTYCSLLWGLLPVANPLLSMLIIRHYRRWLRHPCSKPKVPMMTATGSNIAEART